jgi:GT2 family glycosyltransferase
MKIGYICTNYNNSAATTGAVESFVRATGGESRIIVVDNCSEREDVGKLRHLEKHCAGVEVLAADENVGYFRGINLGLRRLRETEPSLSCVVVGNNDLIFPADFVRAIERCWMSIALNPVVSPDVTTLDGAHQNPHVVDRIRWWRELAYDIYHLDYRLAFVLLWLGRQTRFLTDRSDETHWRERRYIAQGHGSCYVLGPAFFHHFEELWAPTFLLGEEYFLSKQLRSRGFRVLYEPGISVQHQWHDATGALPGKLMWSYSRLAHREYRRHVKWWKGDDGLH